MADYKIVDAEKLDFDLKDIANYIREKGNISDWYQFRFPDDFKTYIDELVKHIARMNTNGELTEAYVEVDGSTNDYGYANNQWLTTVKIADTASKIGSHVFYMCVRLSLDELPDSIAHIGSYCFAHCREITISKMPKNLTSIGPESFAYCTGITTLVFPANGIIIMPWAFRHCTSLTTVTFQGVAEQIYYNTFEDCSNLTTINVPWSEGEVAGAPWGATNATINYNYTGE